MKHKLAIFDLDGVIVDTAKFHFLAWSELAQELGFEFSEKNNERLKGVSRMRSLEILLEIGGLSGKFTNAELESMAAKKNARYVEYISKLTPDDILSGAKELIQRLRKANIKTAIGSASKNAFVILEGLDIKGLFDCVIDGNATTKAKPDPEVFLLAARALGVAPEECVVFEDAQAGIEAANAAKMTAIAVGLPENLKGGKITVKDLKTLEILRLFNL